MMRNPAISLLVTLVLLALVASAYADEGVISVQHDTRRGVTCWIIPGTGISCLPDSQLRQQAGPQAQADPTLAGDEPQDGPTPASTPTPRSHREAFEL